MLLKVPDTGRTKGFCAFAFALHTVLVAQKFYHHQLVFTISILTVFFKITFVTLDLLKHFRMLF